MSHSDAAGNSGRSLSYLGVRRGVGFLSLALPIVLIFGKAWLDGGGIQGSISSYYYTIMGDYFVGTQCAMGVLLLSYRYGRQDNWLSNAVGAFAVGIALFPTPSGVNLTPGQTIVGYVHLTCASLFFLGMAYFSLALFTRTDPRLPPTPQKRRRNVLYRVCGGTILGCLALIVVTGLVLTTRIKDEVHPLFWLECIAVWAISLSWLVKGEFVFLKD